MRQVKAISSWATGAMLGIAGVALLYLFVAFVPLADVWASHRPGSDASAIAGTVRICAWLALAAALLAAGIAFAGWARRARSNLVAFGIRTRHKLPLFDVMVGSVGRSPVLRRRMTVLTWLWWSSLLASGAAVAAGVFAGLDNVREIADVRDRLATGQAVDGALVSHLFGRQLTLRLPGAVLLVVAAALALLLIARVTSAQYGRVARLRGVTALPAAFTALRSTGDDWTVVLPLPAVPSVSSAPVGGTIRE